VRYSLHCDPSVSYTILVMKRKNIRPRKFFQSMVRWVVGLTLALTACTQTQATTPPAASIPTLETILPATPPSPPAPTSTPAPAAPAPIEIVAGQAWQSAYPFVHPGDQLEITATGAWSHHPADPQFSNPYGPAGVDVFDPEAILPSAPVGSLLGRIGENPPFVIGEHRSLTSEYRGQLWVSMNDRPDGFSDNTGSVGVAVRHIPKPPVPGIPLTNMADGYHLLYPPGYYVAITEQGICLTQNEHPVTGTCEEPKTASLEVSESAGRTLAQIADQLITMHDLNFRFDSHDMLVDGEPAVWISMEGGDGILNRVIIIHGDRLYTWSFRSRVPTPSLGQEEGSMAEMDQVQNLYDTVINSFQFLD